MSTTKFSSPVHPGVILMEEFLKSSGQPVELFASKVDLSCDVIHRFIAGELAITREVAVRFSRQLGTVPQMWLELQTRYERQCGFQPPMPSTGYTENEGDDNDRDGGSYAHSFETPGSAN